MYQLVVWIHVLAACSWVGGISFFALVLVPALRHAPGPKTHQLVRAVGRRFRVVGWSSMAILLVTGVANVLYRIPASLLFTAELWQSHWGRMLALKLALVFAMFGVGVAHDVLGARAVNAAALEPGSPAVLRARRLASGLGRALGLLALATVLVAVLLVRGWR